MDGLGEKRLSSCPQILEHHSTEVLFEVNCSGTPFNRGAFKDGCIGLEPQFHRDGYKASKMEGDYKASIKKVIYVEFDIGMKKLGTWISNQISRLRTRLNQISRLLTRSKLGRRSIPGSTPSMRETLEKKDTKKEKNNEGAA